MNPSEVPVIKTKLSSDEKFYPYVVINVFNKYYPFKHQGNNGNQERVIRMLYSKIDTIKITHEQSRIYFRTIIKK